METKLGATAAKLHLVIFAKEVQEVLPLALKSQFVETTFWIKANSAITAIKLDATVVQQHQATLALEFLVVNPLDHTYLNLSPFCGNRLRKNSEIGLAEQI